MLGTSGRRCATVRSRRAGLTFFAAVALVASAMTVVGAPAEVAAAPVVFTGATQIATGGSHSCALMGSGQVRCWGVNGSGQLGNGTRNSLTPVLVGGLSGATQVVTGRQHSCALVTDGQVRCWGDNSRYQLGDGTSSNSSTPVVVGFGTPFSGYTRLAAGGDLTCGTRSDGTATCWGNGPAPKRVLEGSYRTNSFGETVTESQVLSGITQISVGADHSCAVVAGQARCWGANYYGQLGAAISPLAPSATMSYFALVVPGLSGVAEVSAGARHTCARIAGGQVRCWGDNSLSQLGNATAPTATMTPTAVTTSGGNLSGATQISAGSGHTCVRLGFGNVNCWGDNLDGQLGNGTSGPGAKSSTPVPVTGMAGATGVAAGGRHSCALVPDPSAGSTIRCWGFNGGGQLGNGLAVVTPTSVPVAGLSGATPIAAGGAHSCAIVSGGQVRCWGDNSSGQLGGGVRGGYSVAPVLVSGISGATQVAVGGSHSCAVAGAKGLLYCWGFNLDGQLGNGTSGVDAGSSTPVAVTGLLGVSQVALGSDHSCAVLSGGAVRCWGKNWYGQLGNGLSGIGVKSTTPVAVSGLSGVTRIAAGIDRTCAVVTGGAARCWGYDSIGQLGTGVPGRSSSTPVAVSGVSGATAITVGLNHSCVLVAAGAARCWGDNSSGQLGTGAVGGTSATPVAVSGLSGASRLAAGKDHSCVLVAAGAARCWGDNSSGQLGAGLVGGTSATPVAVSGLSGASQLGAGRGHTCVLVAGGAARCWGDSAWGQAGVAPFSSIPVTVVLST